MPEQPTNPAGRMPVAALVQRITNPEAVPTNPALPLWGRILLAIAAPGAAIAAAALASTALLIVSGHDPFAAGEAVADAFGRARVPIATFNLAAAYYLSAVAVAIGFRMNLFNIGVDGQYRLAALLAAGVAGAPFMAVLPSVLRIGITLLVAVVVGALWAGLAAVLKATRGVSEVISTIMLNAIAAGLIAYLLRPGALGVIKDSMPGTSPIPTDGLAPIIEVPGSIVAIYPLALIAVVVGIAYAVVMDRTTLGFRIKASGLNAPAAVAAGVDAKRLTILVMIGSGALAGLIGMPELLNGPAHQFTLNFPAGWGFVGISVALLGRNHPIGMAAAALLWAGLDSSSNSLQSVGVPPELVVIAQGVMVLVIVVAYELVRRYRIRLEQRAVAGPAVPAGPAGPAVPAPALSATN